MAIRLSVCSAAVALTAVTTLAPARAAAQGIDLDVSGGMVTPVVPTNGNVNAGGNFGIGVSHPLVGRPVTLGVEASFVRFGERQLLYASGCCPACMCVPGTPVATTPPEAHLDLANYFVTGKLALFRTGVFHPYIAVAGGITQKWGADYRGGLHPGELNGGGRVGAGAETRLGPVGVALDIAYATVSTLKYDGNLVRYVPVTLRLSF